MSKTVAPLLSFSASGQLGKTLVYSQWKGRPYARRYVIPSNPQTSAQSLTRDAWRGLNRLWAYMPSAATAAWDLYADNLRLTARNAWLKSNLGPARIATDLTTLLLSPSAGGGLVAESMVATPGDDAVTVALTAPPLPTGWTVASAHAVAIADFDPHDDETPDIVAGSDATDPYSITLSGLQSAAAYVVGGWFSFTKPDGSTAYGASLQDSVTTT